MRRKRREGYLSVLPVGSLVTHRAHEARESIHPWPSLLSWGSWRSPAPHRSVHSCWSWSTWSSLLARGTFGTGRSFLSHLTIPPIFAFQAWRRVRTESLDKQVMTCRSWRPSWSVHSFLARGARRTRQTGGARGARITLLTHVALNARRSIETIVLLYSTSQTKSAAARTALPLLHPDALEDRGGQAYPEAHSCPERHRSRLFPPVPADLADPLLRANLSLLVPPARVRSVTKRAGQMLTGGPVLPLGPGCSRT